MDHTTDLICFHSTNVFRRVSIKGILIVPKIKLFISLNVFDIIELFTYSPYNLTEIQFTNALDLGKVL